MTSVLGSKIAWWIDPMGATILALLIIGLWGHTAYRTLKRKAVLMKMNYNCWLGFLRIQSFCSRLRILRWLMIQRFFRLTHVEHIILARYFPVHLSLACLSLLRMIAGADVGRVWLLKLILWWILILRWERLMMLVRNYRTSWNYYLVWKDVIFIVTLKRNINRNIERKHYNFEGQKVYENIWGIKMGMEEKEID